MFSVVYIVIPGYVVISSIERSMTMNSTLVSGSNLRVQARNGGRVYERRIQINPATGFATNAHLRRIYRIKFLPKVICLSDKS